MCVRRVFSISDPDSLHVSEVKDLAGAGGSGFDCSRSRSMSCLKFSRLRGERKSCGKSGSRFCVIV